jgi:hypothetical protein
MSPDRRYMRVLLEHSLKNDSIKEKFALPTGLHGDKSVVSLRPMYMLVRMSWC